MRLNVSPVACTILLYASPSNHCDTTTYLVNLNFRFHCGGSFLLHFCRLKYDKCTCFFSFSFLSNFHNHAQCVYPAVLVSVLESCVPDKSMGNKHYTRFKNTSWKKKNFYLGKGEICKTFRPPKHWNIHTKHDYESRLLIPWLRPGTNVELIMSRMKL